MIRSSPGPRNRDLPAPPALLVEAGLAIVAATLAIRVRPFRRIAEQLDTPGRDRSAADPDTAYWIRRSVSAWGRRLPWRAKCFEQGLAAAWMLRRRELSYQLHYGAARTGGALQAHVWVTSGANPVIGCENLEAFSRLATFKG